MIDVGITTLKKNRQFYWEYESLFDIFFNLFCQILVLLLVQNLWNFEDLSCFCKSVGHKQIQINFDLIFQIFERLRTLHNLEHLGDYLLALYALPALEDLLL